MAAATLPGAAAQAPNEVEGGEFMENVLTVLLLSHLSVLLLGVVLGAALCALFGSP